MNYKMNKEIKTEIENEVYKSTRKSEEVLTNLVKDVQDEMKNHNKVYNEDIAKVHQNIEKLCFSQEDVAKDIKEIKIQTKETNGRVTGLEKREQYVKGGLAVLTLLVVPILIAVIIRMI